MEGTTVLTRLGLPATAPPGNVLNGSNLVITLNDLVQDFWTNELSMSVRVIDDFTWEMQALVFAEWGVNVSGL